MTGPVYIAGPTASGKSALALLIAETLGGEIISVDSMQVYKGLDIGTAKPSAAERASVPHHLIDEVEVTAPFDAAQFVQLAGRARSAIEGRGNIPIFCGGTGLYFNALISGIGSGPGADPKLRSELERAPAEKLLEELKAADPQTFERIDRKNPRRLIRAVEVIRLTGRPFSEQRAEWRSEAPEGTWIGIERERADLNDRINRRVDEMFARGLVEETREMMRRGLEQNPTAMQALGYRQVAAHLRGELSLEATVDLVKLKTRQFAKRQMTWFKRQLNLQWIPAGPDDGAPDLLQKAMSLPPLTR